MKLNSCLCPMPFACKRPDFFQVLSVTSLIAAPGFVTPADVFGMRHAFKIVQCIVLAIFVLVMDMESIRDRAVCINPYLPMKVNRFPDARCSFEVFPI